MNSFRKISTNLIQYINNINKINLIPNNNYNLNYETIQQYIEMQPNKESKLFAHLSLKYTRHVNFETFYKDLVFSLELYQNFTHEKSCVIIPNESIRNHSSELWIFLLLYNKLSPNIIEISDSLELNPNINNVVLIDDAIYSGMHIANNIYNIISHNNDRRIKFNIITPYVTLNAIKYIRNLFPNNKIVFHYKNIMKPIKDIITRHFIEKYDIRKKEAIKLVNNIGSTFLIEKELNPVAIFFDHKIPDEMSCICTIYLGVISNYKTNKDNSYFKPLIDNIKCNNGGHIVAFYKEELKKINKD